MTAADQQTVRPRPRSDVAVVSRGPDSLADVLERVLDKGVVIVGDVSVNLLDIELLTLKVRLLIASVDTAKRMGIDWWTTDPFIVSAARRDDDERKRLEERIRELEQKASEP